MENTEVIVCGHSVSFLISVEPIRLDFENDKHHCYSGSLGLQDPICHCRLPDEKGQSAQIRTTESGFEWFKRRRTALLSLRPS